MATTTRIDEILYHGSKENFSSFRPSTSVVRGRGIFLSDSVRYAKEFGDLAYVCKVVLDNPKVYPRSVDFCAAALVAGDSAEKLTLELAEGGFDGAVIERSRVSIGTVREVICFGPESVTILEVWHKGKPACDCPSCKPAGERASPRGETA
jgi:hypothetical protein